MTQSKESSAAWQFTKGMVVSQFALTTSLIKAGVITVEDVVKELDSYISIFSENFPDSETLIEPIKLTKDMILKAFEKPIKSGDDRFTWFADFIGQA